eukprot:gene29975-37421_t
MVLRTIVVTPQPWNQIYTWERILQPDEVYVIASTSWDQNFVDSGVNCYYNFVEGGGDEIHDLTAEHGPGVMHGRTGLP